MNHWCCCILVLLVLKLDSFGAVNVGKGSGKTAYRHNSKDNHDWQNGRNASLALDKDADSRGALGQGFEIHKIDLLTKELQGTGSEIFEDFDYEECTISSNLGTTSKDSSFYSSTESLYSAISTNTKVDASLKGAYTLGVSVSAVTNNIASSERDVSGMSLDLKAKTKSEELKRDCLRKSTLAKDFVKDFEDLDKEIKKPWRGISWRKYNNFLKKYGSHIVKSVTSGSSIHQYVFAETTQQFNQRDFAVKACVSLEGPTQVGKLGISACSGVSKKEIEESSKTSMVEKLVVRGGSSKTRSELTQELKPEKISAFLEEGDSSPSPISYGFYPIWQLLGIRYIGTEHYAKVLNLEQYYKGYLSFGCHYEEATNEKVDIQRFELREDSDPEAPIYQCSLGPDSCHDANDCSYRVGVWCACKGPSCIRYHTKKLTSGLYKKEAYANGDEVAWHGCSGAWESWCSCYYPSNVREVSWSGSSTMQDMHLMMLDKNRDEAEAAKRRSKSCKT